MKKKRVLATLAACGAAGLLTIGGAFAYLTNAETVTNTFTVGKVNVDLLEPNYPGNGSDQATNLLPGEEVKKDPQVKNTGRNPVVIFTRVNIPVENVVEVEEGGQNNGKRKAKGLTEMFWFRKTTGAITGDGGYNSVDPKWKLLSTSYLDKDGKVLEEVRDYNAIKDSNRVDTALPNGTVSVSRLYGYQEVVEPDSTTNPVFQTVRLTNVTSEWQEKPEEIKIVTYAIQSDNIAGLTTDESKGANYHYAEKDMSQEQLANIYNVYVNQEVDVTQDGSIPDANTTKDLTTNTTTMNIQMRIDDDKLELNTKDPADKVTQATATLSYVGENGTPAQGNTDNPSQITFTVEQEKDADGKEATKGSIITIDSTGKITAAGGVGTAVVRATATNPDNGQTVSASHTIRVVDGNSGTNTQK